MTKWFTSENGDKFGPLNLSTPPLPQTMLLLLLPSAAFSIYNKESQKIGLKFNGDKPGWVSFQSFNLIVPLLLLFLFVRAAFMIPFYPFTTDRQTDNKNLVLSNVLIKVKLWYYFVNLKIRKADVFSILALHRVLALHKSKWQRAINARNVSISNLSQW